MNLIFGLFLLYNETTSYYSAICFRRDAGFSHWRHEIGQAVLAVFSRREWPQVVPGRQAKARRRVQVRISAYALTRRTLLDTCHVSFIIFQNL